MMPLHVSRRPPTRRMKRAAGGVRWILAAWGFALATVVAVHVLDPPTPVRAMLVVGLWAGSVAFIRTLHAARRRMARAREDEARAVWAVAEHFTAAELGRLRELRRRAADRGSAGWSRRGGRANDDSPGDVARQRARGLRRRGDVRRIDHTLASGAEGSKEWPTGRSSNRRSSRVRRHDG